MIKMELSPMFYKYDINNYPKTAISIGIADADRNGEAEIFYVSGDYRIICIELNGNVKFVSEPAISDFLVFFTDFPSVNIADLNGDGTPEVVFALNIFDGITGEHLYSPPNNFHPGYPVGRYVLADILPDDFCPDCKGIEIIGADYVLSISENNRTVTQQVKLDNPRNARGQSAVADWDLDGDLDVISIFNSSTSEQAIIWEGQNNTQFHSKRISNSESTPIICNIDEDLHPELIIVSDIRGVDDIISCYDNDLSAEWIYSFKDASSISAVGF